MKGMGREARVIMFLIRFAFWMMLVVALIPVNAEDLGPEYRAVSTQETVLAAQAAMRDLSKFCERNKQTCETGRELVSQLGVKAATGARFVSAYLEDRFGESGSLSNAEPTDQTMTGAVKG